MSVSSIGIQNKPDYIEVGPNMTPDPQYSSPDFLGAVEIEQAGKDWLKFNGYPTGSIPLDKWFQDAQDKANFDNTVALSNMQFKNQIAASHYSLEQYYDSLKNTPELKVEGMKNAGINPLIATGAMVGGNPNPAPVGGGSPQSFNSTPTTHKDKFDKAGTLLFGLAAIVGAVAKLI